MNLVNNPDQISHEEYKSIRILLLTIMATIFAVGFMVIFFNLAPGQFNYPINKAGIIFSAFWSLTFFLLAFTFFNRFNKYEDYLLDAKKRIKDISTPKV